MLRAADKTAQESVEESFKRGLLDAVEIVKKIAPLCTDVRHLLDVMELATENEAQSEFLLNFMKIRK